MQRGFGVALKGAGFFLAAPLGPVLIRQGRVPPQHLANAGHGFMQPFRNKGLQQIVDGLEIEGLNGVFVVSGGKDKQGNRPVRFTVVFPDPSGGVDAGTLRHLDIEKNHVRPVSPVQLQELLTVFRAGAQFHVLFLTDEISQFLPGQRFILGDHRFNRHLRQPPLLGFVLSQPDKESGTTRRCPRKIGWQSEAGPLPRRGG